MHKVYCKDCIYCSERPLQAMPIGFEEKVIFYRCLKLSIINRDAIGYLYFEKIMDCKDQNAHKNCKYYRRKWWKFYVRNWCSIGEIAKPTIPPMPKVKKSDVPTSSPPAGWTGWKRGDRFEGCSECKKGNLFFHWQGKYFYLKCDKCGYLADTGRKMTSKEKKDKI